MRLAIGRARLDPLLLSAWGEGRAGRGEGFGRRFVDKLIERSSATDATQAEQIRRILHERHFAF